MPGRSPASSGLQRRFPSASGDPQSLAPNCELVEDWSEKPHTLAVPSVWKKKYRERSGSGRRRCCPPCYHGRCWSRRRCRRPFHQFDFHIHADLLQLVLDGHGGVNVVRIRGGSLDLEAQTIGIARFSARRALAFSGRSGKMGNLLDGQRLSHVASGDGRAVSTAWPLNTTSMIS